ncbi:MAG: hypothetical protein ACFCU7_07240 [Pleurocapsa sp.]
MANNILNTLKKIGRYLIVNRTEPRVRQKGDRSGNSYWQIYDPVTGSNCSLSSEQEVRTWLDTRYY